VLLDYGLPEHIVEALATHGVTTVGKLGEMTPEDLESIPSVGADWVERLRDAVIAYYAQYEEAMGVEEQEVAEQEPTADVGNEMSYVEEADAQHDERPEQSFEEEHARETEGIAHIEPGDIAILQESDSQAEGNEDESARLRDAD
jgi:hypothetical protein